MQLRSLSFRNFRNLRDAQVVDIPSAPLLVAAAPNATGKTNFLESIAVLLRGKSFRASHEECVAWGQDMFLVQGKVEGRDGEVALAVQYHIPSHKLRIEQDTQPVSPVLFYANYPFVLFLPEDTFLLHRGPALRRNFLNNALAASPAYLSGLVQYQRALRQRNSALKTTPAGGEIVEAWTHMLVEYANTVWTHRQALVAYMNAQLPQIAATVAGLDETIQIQLVQGVPDGQGLGDALALAREQEQRYRYTLYGPHRDDISVLVGGRPAAAVLSRGQVRALVIAMKVAVYHFIKQTSGIVPLLLFDEVLSELDHTRQKAVFDVLPPTQTLITCTDIPAEIRQRSDVFMLDLGQLTSQNNEQEEPASVVVADEEPEAVPVR